MKKNVLLFKVMSFTIMIGILLVVLPESHAQNSAISVNKSGSELSMTIDAGNTGSPINPYIFGQFTENANNNFYHGGLWAEMLDDRKFYYPITSSRDQSRSRRGRILQWLPVGGDDVVTMDRERAYSGDQSPRIALDAIIPHGITQMGLGVSSGRDYVGRVIIAADGKAEVTVTLIWGESENERQTARITGITGEYKKYPLTFRSGGDSRAAALEITATGTGSLHIGAVSLMPADNINGWRADMIAALKEIAPTMIRLGGNFVSGYEWRDGIGDPDKRPSRFDYAWQQMETNDVGTDEFLQLTSILQAEPYITVNDGFGDAHSAAQWVEYVNGDAATAMGKLRAQNGHPEPYKVTWWNIGNEMYGSWQLGNMPLRQYTIKHNMFAKAMRQVDPNIKIVAVGATPAEMGTTGSAFYRTGRRVAEYGGPADWNFAMLTESVDYFDALAEHLYPKGNQAFDVNEQNFVRVNEPIEWSARRLPNRVKCAVEAWQEYQKLFPDLDMKSIPIALDEWAPGNPGTRSAAFSTLSSAEALHELFRNSSWFLMSEFTHLTGLVRIDRVSTSILPVGTMFKLYRWHFGQIPVEVTGNSPQPDVEGLAGLDKPKVPSGSDTYPLDVAAALTTDRKMLTVAIVNPAQSEVGINVSFRDVSLQPKGKLYRIAAPGMTSQRPAGQEVTIIESEVTDLPGRLTIPAQSISIYELTVQPKTQTSLE